MDLKKRIQRLEQQTGVRPTQREEYTPRKLSDEELFWLCHGCSPYELQGKVKRAVRQYTDSGFRLTIRIEAVE